MRRIERNDGGERGEELLAPMVAAWIADEAARLELGQVVRDRLPP
ncbi:MAG: hypothetical protein ACHREM_06460 [Polyangiales bacterium]